MLCDCVRVPLPAGKVVGVTKQGSVAAALLIFLGRRDVVHFKHLTDHTLTILSSLVSSTKTHMTSF